MEYMTCLQWSFHRSLVKSPHLVAYTERQTYEAHGSGLLASAKLIASKKSAHGAQYSDDAERWKDGEGQERAYHLQSLERSQAAQVSLRLSGQSQWCC